MRIDPTHHENEFKITFDALSADRVRVYVNDRSVGAVTVKDVLTKDKTKRVDRLTYRGSSSPFKHLIPTSQHEDLTKPVAELLRDSMIYRHVVCAVLSDYLYHYENLAIREHDSAMIDDDFAEAA